MQYEKRPTDVEAIKLRYPMTIEGPNGTVKGKKGDWLVTEGERQYFMGPGDFDAAFAPKVDPPSAPPTYVPYPMPYPVYPQATPYWQPSRWYLSTGSTSGNISISEPLGQLQLINATNTTPLNTVVMYGDSTSDARYTIGD